MLEFSIIIPVYNSQSTLENCLKSVINQTIQDFEILCCYDESNDKSKQIIENYCNKDARIQLVNGRNKGLSGARNDGISVARGKYIMFLDSDDTFLPNALLRVKKEFEKHNCDIVVYGTKIIPEKPRAEVWYYYVLTTPNRYYKKFTTKALFGEMSARPFVWRNAFTKEFIKKNDLRFEEDCKVGEDQIFQICAFPHAENGIAFIKEKLYCYNWCRNGSLMQTYNKNFLFKYSGHVKMVNSVINYWQNRNYDNIPKKDLLIWALFFLETDIYKLSKAEIKKIIIDNTNFDIKTFITKDLFECSSLIIRKKINYLNKCNVYQYRKISSLLYLIWWYYYFAGGIGLLRFLYIKIFQIFYKMINGEKNEIA